MGEELTDNAGRSAPFNSPFETGIRSVGLLVAAYPSKFDLHKLVAFDHLVVHTGDIGGPESLHPDLPMRSSELLVRRGLVERGLLLMMSRGLVERATGSDGISYRAGEFADTFLSSLTSTYVRTLRERANWVIHKYADIADDDFSSEMSSFFGRWIEQFQVAHDNLAGDA